MVVMEEETTVLQLHHQPQYEELENQIQEKI